MTSAGRCRGLDHLGHGEGLARAGDAEQHLARLAILADSFDQFADRRRLVAGGLVVGDELEQLAALRLVGPRGLVRHEGLAVSGSASDGADLNRHRCLYGQEEWTEQPRQVAGFAGARSAGASNITIPRRRAVGTWEGVHPICHRTLHRTFASAELAIFGVDRQPGAAGSLPIRLKPCRRVAERHGARSSAYQFGGRRCFRRARHRKDGRPCLEVGWPGRRRSS